MKISRRHALGGLGLAATGAMMSPSRQARAQTRNGDAAPVKIGVLTDLNGVLSAALGTGSIDGARMAIEDHGSSVLGRPVELVFADHQNKADIGATIARRWYDEEGVDFITDIGNSTVALAVQQITREKNKILVVTSAATSEITDHACSPNGFGAGYDTYTQSHAIATKVTKEGAKTWAFIVSDYAFGHALQTDATKAIEAAGGRVISATLVPPASTDFSAVLLQAQASGAQAIGLMSSVQDLDNQIKQGAEFNCFAGRTVVAPGVLLVDPAAVGLSAMQGIQATTVFYWDLDDETRAFSARFEKRNGHPPFEGHALIYSAINHYLTVVAAAGTKNTDAVLPKMVEIPVNDFFTKGARYRPEDHRLIRDVYALRIKSPEQSTGKWDCFDITGKLDPADAYRPLSQSSCRMHAA